MVKWWSDLRGRAAFGFWWDAMLVKFANTPTVADMQTTLGNVNARFRGFTYPKNLASDVNQYPHGQTQFNDKTVIVCSSLIEHIVRQALTLSAHRPDGELLQGLGQAGHVGLPRPGRLSRGPHSPTPRRGAQSPRRGVAPPEAPMLGDCEKCQGPLCVSGGEVVCENCGHAHPAAAAALGGPPDRSAPPPAPVIPPQEYAATLGDRVLQLEKANARLAARVDQLEAAARPEAQPAGRRR
jgi:uncharacterized Zn finger protein (UPF0148 family)